VASNFQLLGRREDAYASGDTGSAPVRTTQAKSEAADEYDIGDLGPPLDMDNNPLSPGD